MSLSFFVMLRTDLFAKPTTKSCIIHKESNHQPSILMKIPVSIESRVSKYSSNEKIFKESTQIYQEAIKKINNDLYKACITPNKEKSKTKIYCGAAFKLRYANHKKAFNNAEYQTNTELSNKYCNITSANKSWNISWEIFGTHKPYNQSFKRCLCLNKNLAIALHKDDYMLNKRFKVRIKCRHRNKYMLANCDSKD